MDNWTITMQCLWRQLEECTVFKCVQLSWRLQCWFFIFLTSPQATLYLADNMLYLYGFCIQSSPVCAIVATFSRFSCPQIELDTNL